MKKLEVKSNAQIDKSLWYIIVDSQKIFHGDKILATIPSEDDDDEALEITKARLCINKVDINDRGFRAWICQDVREGCNEAEDKFEYQYSWTFSVDENGNITSEDAHSVEAIPERDSVIINGVTYHEGSLIQADIRKGGHWTTVVGRLNFINLTPASNEYVICQDIYPGSEKFTTPAIIDAKPRYGFKHSWSFHVKNGKITTADTRNIKLIYTTDYLAFVSGSPKDESYKLDINPDIDDDPMPEGWTPSEKDLIFLK